MEPHSELAGLNIPFISDKCILHLVACDEPPPIANAIVDTKGGTLVNQLRVYTCLPGFHPTGPVEAICMGEKGAAYWKLSPHKCIRKCLPKK